MRKITHRKQIEKRIRDNKKTKKNKKQNNKKKKKTKIAIHSSWAATWIFRNLKYERIQPFSMCIRIWSNRAPAHPFSDRRQAQRDWQNCRKTQKLSRAVHCRHLLQKSQGSFRWNRRTCSCEPPNQCDVRRRKENIGSCWPATEGSRTYWAGCTSSGAVLFGTVSKISGTTSCNGDTSAAFLHGRRKITNPRVNERRRRRRSTESYMRRRCR